VADKTDSPPAIPGLEEAAEAVVTLSSIPSLCEKQAVFRAGELADGPDRVMPATGWEPDEHEIAVRIPVCGEHGAYRLECCRLAVRYGWERNQLEVSYTKRIVGNE
jgi:hypothetical protein